VKPPVDQARRLFRYSFNIVRDSLFGNGVTKRVKIKIISQSNGYSISEEEKNIRSSNHSSQLTNSHFITL